MFFAPGVKIYSAVPGGNTYANLQGTSMASPVVAGVAAFLLNYYPNLTPQQVKYVIETSAVKPSSKVKSPGGNEMDLSEISKTGGVLNAYEAAVLAEKISSGKPVAATKKNVKAPAVKEKKQTAKKAF